MEINNDNGYQNVDDDLLSTEATDLNVVGGKQKIISCAKETFENASRLLRRRVPCTGYLMTPRRLWLNKIPTQQCDVVIEFSPTAPDEALLWLLSRLRAPNPGPSLTVHVRKHDSTQCTAFYISASNQVLLQAAEESRLPKALKPELGSGLREFSTREVNCFQKCGDSLFTSQERQWLVLQILQALRVGSKDENYANGTILPEGQAILAGWQMAGIISQVYPLHEAQALGKLQATWVRDVLAPQPLDDICSYFGVKVGLYFAWLGHYTMALCVPALIGSLLWLGLLNCGQTVQDIGYVLFSVFNVIWASLYLEAWRRYSVQLAFRWGTLGTPPDLLEPPRPMFTGPLEPSPVTGRLEPADMPAWKRNIFRFFVSGPLIALSLCAVFAVMISMLQLQDWWDKQVANRGLWSCLGVMPKVFLAAAITLMDEAYFKLAVWLNDQENHRLESKYENHLIAKVALFQFVNSFLSLFYIAFYLQDQERLREQLAGLLIARQVIGNFRESAWPYLMEQWRLAKLSFKIWGALSPTAEKSETKFDDTTSEKPTTPLRSIGQAELESSLYKYEGTFYDHLEMLVQMGYVVLFSSAFPLAALCALLNNLLEIRSDAFKLVHVHQRPFGQRVANIGTWQSSMSLLALLAVLINCALIGLSGPVSRLMPGLTPSQTILLIVVLEHMMLGLRFALTWLLPELPAWLAAEMARAEHMRREAARKGSAGSQKSSPHSSQGSTAQTPQSKQSKVEDEINIDEEESRIFEEKLIGRFSVKSMSTEEDDNMLLPSTILQPPPRSPSAVSTTRLFLSDDNTVSISRSISPNPTPPITPTVPQKIELGKLAEIPPFKPRKSKEWVPEESLGHHLTIGPGGGAEWAKRLKGDAGNIHRSTECITPKPQDLAASSDSDLLRAAPWTGSGSVSPSRVVNSVPSIKTPTGSAPTPGPSSLGNGDTVNVTASTGQTTEEAEKAAKKLRVKQSLVKRARSVAIFSLKLKERRAKEAEKAAANSEPKVKTPTPQWGSPHVGGGELSCIPIEKLIQVDDVMKKRNGSGSSNQ
ncbi:anoctamin-8 [Ctenocephalides felis]|uniref:anoctamin-8 n=1 Tax=Ctenocephalides felis TaxID=7515 RepID=UPI000E6E2D09|nr:anoctamin-8 [Ctenocephalides felis]